MIASMRFAGVVVCSSNVEGKRTDGRPAPSQPLQEADVHPAIPPLLLGKATIARLQQRTDLPHDVLRVRDRFWSRLLRVDKLATGSGVGSVAVTEEKRGGRKGGEPDGVLRVLDDEVEDLDSGERARGRAGAEKRADALVRRGRGRGRARDADRGVEEPHLDFLRQLVRG